MRRRLVVFAPIMTDSLAVAEEEGERLVTMT